MKGLIMEGLREVVTEKFGGDIWAKILTEMGVPVDTSYGIKDDVDDEIVLGAVQSTCSVLGVTLEQAADLFGSHWINRIAKRYYSPILSLYGNSRELLLAIDEIHERVVDDLPGSKPPRFEFTWEDERTLLVDYHSHRGLIDFAVGIARGVGEYYDEDLEITKRSDKQFTIVFPAA